MSEAWQREILSVWIGVMVSLAVAIPAIAQNGTASKSQVQISFLPPPLEDAAFSLGIYDAKGKLVRRLHEAAPESAFTAGLNGLITRWDRKDDEGKVVASGKYAARGYAIGPLKIEGIAFHGNDWVSQDENLRVKDILCFRLAPEDDDLVVLCVTADHWLGLLRLSGKDGALLWKQRILPGLNHEAAKKLFVSPIEALTGMEIRGEKIFLFWETGSTSYRLSNGESLTTGYVDKYPESNPLIDPVARPDGGPWLRNMVCVGKDSTCWFAREVGLFQFKGLTPPDLAWGGHSEEEMRGAALRYLPPKPDDPEMCAVSASVEHDKLYLAEKSPGWQRLRGLSWVEATEKDGKPVSTWDTFFERNIRRPDPALGLEDQATASARSPVIEVGLAENELSPGKRGAVNLTATMDEKGSYLATADGLRLRRVSERFNLRAVKLTKGKEPGTLSFFQTDGAAWDEFSIAGAARMMAFDAGEIELTADGEKPTPAKAAEPDL